jgi:hypothetical protein
MSTPENGPETFIASPAGEALLAQLGGAATREVATRPSADIAQALRITETTNQRQAELETTITELGDQKLSIIDIVLGVDGAIKDFEEATEGFVPKVVVYKELAPAFLKALIPDEHTGIRKQLSRVWKEYLAAQAEPTNQTPVRPFGKGKPHRPPTGRTDRHKPKPRSQAKEERAKRRRSSSLEASAKFSKLQRESE